MLPQTFRQAYHNLVHSMAGYQIVAQDDLEKSSVTRGYNASWASLLTTRWTRCVQWATRKKRWTTVYVTILLLALYLLLHRGEHAAFSVYSVQPQNLPPRHLRLIAPTTDQLLDPTDDGRIFQYNAMMCKSLVASFALGYPAPTLTNFNLSFTNPFMIHGGSHLAKIDGVRKYLDDLGPEYDDDVAFMIDITDTWVQLPPEIVISRYFQLVKDSERRLHAKYGKAAEAAGMKARVFFSVQKGCGLNDEQGTSRGCVAAPDSSSLPDDVFGPLTDMNAPEPERVYVYRRPRWVNSGFVIGTVGALRPVFRRLHDLSHHGYGNIGSDQFIVTETVAQQEAWRHTQLSKHTTRWTRAKSWVKTYLLASATKPEADGVDWEGIYPFDPSVNYELGIGLDDGSAISQVGWSYEKELEYIVHDSPASIRALAGDRRIVSDAALSLPKDFATLPAPLSNPALHANNLMRPPPLEGEPTASPASPSLSNWSSIPLVTNLYTGQIPAMVHMCGTDWKARINTHWKATWYFPYLRSLLDTAALAGTARSDSVVPSDGRVGDDDTQVNRTPIATLVDDYGRRQEWYSRTAGGGLLATDVKDGPKYVSLQEICGTWWGKLLDDGKGDWVNPVTAA